MTPNEKDPKTTAQAEAATAQPAAAPQPEEEKKAKKPKLGKDAKLAGLEEKLADSQAKEKALSDQLLRTAAEYDNYRRRSQKEQEAAFNNGVSHAALQLLPVLDTLNAAAEAETADAEYKKGVLLTLQKCEEIFDKLGISEIEALGQPFDPEVHNACMQDDCEGHESGTITKVIQKGYKMGERVIRHAMVAVKP